MLLKQIEVRTVFGDKEEILTAVMTDKTKPHKLMRVRGVAKSLKRGKSKFEDRQEGDQNKNSDWVAFIGVFRATSFATGQEFDAPKCFLPGFAADIVAGQFSGDDEVQSVEFGFDISAHFDKDAITSYVYDIEPLTDFGSSELDALDIMIAKDNPLQIAPPKDAKK